MKQWEKDILSLVKKKKTADWEVVILKIPLFQLNEKDALTGSHTQNFYLTRSTFYQ